MPAMVTVAYSRAGAHRAVGYGVDRSILTLCRSPDVADRARVPDRPGGRAASALRAAAGGSARVLGAASLSPMTFRTAFGFQLVTAFAGVFQQSLPLFGRR